MFSLWRKELMTNTDTSALEALQRRRSAFARQRWGEAYQQLSNADREAALAPEDLLQLALASQLTGHDEGARYQSPTLDARLTDGLATLSVQLATVWARHGLARVGSTIRTSAVAAP